MGAPVRPPLHEDHSGDADGYFAAQVALGGSIMPMMARAALLLEFLAIFGGGPVLVMIVRAPLLFQLLLWLGALAAWRLTRNQHPPGLEADGLRRELRAIVLRFVAVALVLVVVTRLAMPEAFFAFPWERPWLWLAVMVGYPLLSAWPQEMLYRRFAYSRYAPLFGSGTGFIAASGLAFGYAHGIFLNPIAVALSAAGGLLFAANFARHRSLTLVWLEHSLYGCLIFTIGLGSFFFTGALWHP
jgi:hypothetical protein